MHPLSTPGEAKIIFRDTESFGAALRAIASGDKSFGDLTPWARLIDPFGDGQGRKRSGEVICNYVRARDRGLDRDAALREAVITYAARYRSVLATTRFTPHASDADPLWRVVFQRDYRHEPPAFPYTAGTLATPPLTPGKGQGSLSPP
jgi:hypothetical protein